MNIIMLEFQLNQLFYICNVNQSVKKKCPDKKSARRGKKVITFLPFLLASETY